MHKHIFASSIICVAISFVATSCQGSGNIPANTNIQPSKDSPRTGTGEVSNTASTPTAPEAQSVTGDVQASNLIKISPPTQAALDWHSGQGIYEAGSFFELPYNKGQNTEEKVTVVCELEHQGGDKQKLLTTTSFHDVDLTSAQGSVKVHFATQESGIKGEGTLRVYLTRRQTPNPLPVRFVSMMAGTLVYMDKPLYTSENKNKMLSNIVSIPVEVRY